MSFLKKISTAFWRTWYYVLLGVPIIIMFPLLLLFTSSERFYPQFFVLARFWAKIIIYGMGFSPQIKRMQHIEKGKSYMLIANHTSMMDIMLMLYTVKQPFVFVGKKELTRIPIFGFFYKRTCILVDRTSAKSRRDVFYQAQRRLDQGASICFFPEGHVPEDFNVVLDEFKVGAFRLALDHEIPIVPIVFFDNKKRFSYKFFSGSPGKMRVKILPFVETKGKTHRDKPVLKKQLHALFFQYLQEDDF